MESPISGTMQSSSADYEDLDSLPADGSSLPSFHTLPPPPASLPSFEPIASYLASPELVDSPLWAPTVPLYRPFPQQLPLPAAGPPSVSGAGSPSSSSPHPPAATAPRGSKKRSRASRRAPTTVLTTDTSNFRAMVQEFTGIPAPPFVSSQFPRRPRLDLLHPASPPYALRPFVQKPQSPAGSSLPSSVPPPTPSSSPFSASINSIGNGGIPLRDPNPSNEFLSFWPINGGALESIIPGASANVAASCEPDDLSAVRRPYSAEKKPAAIAGGKGASDPWLLSSD
ncbi:hypothetical protein AXF42_Ash016500 [Apostasia shenzhenica]|uniref:VQ domain-containing protein n=1 Tax=Apostasia shenzhenica TaxID=1088818 RepID=A0A2I0AVD5_9ASPA|nr:hypothetical protein AXF42_Ash016500 [Apostasia shenzhenica]